MTIAPDPDDSAEVAAAQTPEGEPDGKLIDPLALADEDTENEASEEVLAG